MNRIILRFLIPYLVVLAIPIILGGVIFAQSIRMSVQEVTSANLKLLDQSMRIIEGRLSEMKMISHQIVSNSKIVHFQQMYDPFYGSNVNRILETRSELRSYPLNSDFLFTYFVLYKNSDLILSGESTYTSKAFYEDVMSFHNIPYQKWYDQMLGKYHQSVFFPAQEATYLGKSYSFVTFAQSLGYPGFSQGVVIGVIDNRKIEEFLKEFDFSQGGWAYIADDKGNIISSYNSGSPKGVKMQNISLQGLRGISEERIDSKRMMVTHTTSRTNGWSYVVAQPSDIVLGKVNYIRKWTGYVTAVILLLGILFAYLLAYKSSRPIKALIGTIQRLDFEIRPKDVFKLIQAAFIQLARKNDELKDAVNTQLPILRSVYLSRLFQGELRHESEMDMLFSEKNLVITGNIFTVGLIQIEEQSDASPSLAPPKANFSRAKVQKTLEDLIASNGFVHAISEKRIAVLFVLPEASPPIIAERITALIEDMKAEMGKSLKCSSYWGIGGSYTRLIDVTRSNEEAKFALQHATFSKERRAAWYGEHPQDSNMHFYPGDWEVRLIHVTQSGSADDARRILDQIYLANFVDRQLSQVMLRVLYYDMLGTVAKLSETDLLAESGVRQQWVSLLDSGPPESYDDYEKMYGVLRELFIDLCLFVDQRKKSRNNTLKQDILSYVDKHYNQPDMCLNMVADAFEMSEMYVSQFFKEQSGSNFSDYLEDKRMEETRKLLAGTALSINDIAAQTGYASFNTFCRAFKRIHGLSATSYRKTVKDTIVPH
ncbi:AraC family transcriptional regulator [Paenibacillus aceris]|uniref:AraC-like DNA-binding protein n=1 Tax=Paenibacillus aceris TaxID=869555 RepID=A0ABS4HQC3_9BACL|nr:AraC family transcriptional regulator [Paenibacillus aceris]MBP1960813.1 AraC-like DNA-binding protein [Paenibacillus aceris]